MIKRIVFGSLATLIIVVLSIIVFLGTPFGLKSAVALTRKLSNNHIQIYNAHGSLMGQVSADQVRIIDHYQRIEINNIKLDWRPIYLFLLHLNVKQLSVGSVYTVLLRPLPVQVADNKSSSSFSLPLDINIENAQIDRFRYYNKTMQRNYVLRKLKLQALYNANNLNVHASTQMQLPYRIDSRLDVSGSPHRYRIRSRIITPIITSRIDGQGNQKQVNLQLNETSALGGKLTGSIDAQWQPNVHIKTNLSARKLQLGDHWINGVIKANYHGINDFNIDTRLITSLGRINIVGKHQNQWNVNWNVDLNHLEKLSPLLLGSIQGKGQVLGDTQHPDAIGQLNLSNLAFANSRLKQMNAKWKLTLHQNKPSIATIKLRGLTSPGINVAQASTTVNGTLKQHTLQLSANTDYGQLMLKASGKYSEKSSLWQGVMQQLSLTGKPLSSWHLNHAVPFSISSNSVAIPQFCLMSRQGGQFCLSYQQAKTWQAQLKGHINFSAMPALELDQARLRGRLNLQAQASGKQHDIDQGQLSINAQKLSLLLGTAPLQQTLRFKTMTTQALLKKHQLQASQTIQMSNGDQLLATLNASPVPNNNPKINAKLKLKIGRSQQYRYTLPTLVAPTGPISANLNIGGHLDNPTLKGIIDLSRTAIHLPDIGIHITRGMIIANTSGDHLKLNAKLYSNGKPINIHSDTKLKDYSFDGTTRITGSSVPVINTLDYRANASPDLTMTIKHKLVSITGSLLVPDAMISPKNFNSTTTLPNNDIVYVNEAEAVPSLWKSELKVDAKLGNNVKVDTYGVTGKLNGTLTLLHRPGQTFVGNGKLSMQDGKFDSHGHKLDISRANVIFRNSPIDNPELDLTASRTLNTYSSAGLMMLGVESLTVGVHVTGHAHQPKLSLFSSPVSLNQTDILSYLLLGHGSGGGSAADVTLLINAFNSGGTGGIGSLVGGLEKGLGLSEFGVQSETALDISGNPINSESSFVVGKYLTPKVYIRYSRGLVDQNNTVLLRYMITPKWAVQTSQSNLGTGGDIIYTFYRH